MTEAICYKCGSEKQGAYSLCEQCGVAPQDTFTKPLSLALSDHLSSKAQLEKYSHQIKTNGYPTIPDDVFLKAVDQALDAVEQALVANLEPQHKTQLEAAQQAAPSIESAPRRTQNTFAHVNVEQPTPENLRSSGPVETVLHRNAFWLLGATTRDDRQRIVELAEEKSLSIDHEVCQKARSDLTSPRARLAVEMAWLPGVSPKKAAQLARQVQLDPMSVRSETGLPILSHANLLAAAFEAVDATYKAGDVAAFIQEKAQLVEKISINDVLRDINEDRAVSRFPEIKAGELIEAELAERKRYYRNAIKDALNRLPPATLIAVMTEAVDSVTEGGAHHAPELIDSLVDSYEVETQGFLQKEAENIHKLIEVARDCAKTGESAVKPLIDKLEGVARNWDKVAQPIQLSAKARGIEHQSSSEMATSIRNLALFLFNEHDMLAQSKRITGLLKELFAELPEVAERVEQDANALDEIFHNRENAESSRSEWAKEITYRTEIGMVFKDTLSISPDGVSWKEQHYPLDAITRVRWGGVRHSVNGIPTGTTHTIAFGDKNSEAVIELKREEVYSTFIDKLWRAVCIRLLTELLAALKAGQEVPFGDALIRNDGVTLTKFKFIGPDEHIRYSWNQIHIWTADGAFYIGAKDDKKAYAKLSYIESYNTHILEQAIRMFFKKQSAHVISDLLKND